MVTSGTAIRVYPEMSHLDAPHFRAVAGGISCEGATIGQAIDSLNSRLGGNSHPRWILVASEEPDEFFSADQQARLAALVARQGAASEIGADLPPDERGELDGLIREELLATQRRLSNRMGNPAP